MVSIRLPVATPRSLAAMLCAVLSAGQMGMSQFDVHAQFLAKLAAAAVKRTHHSVRYDSSYVGIPYPKGDVPADTGVCTDEVIRAYRAVGVDLQQQVHEDMKRNFSAYSRFGPHPARHPDANIDHRRVPNLMVFFSRRGASLKITDRAEDYVPGDLIAWDLGGNVTHIGIVVDHKSSETGRWMIVYNTGRGPSMEDVLFNWKIIGHDRYFGD